MLALANMLDVLDKIKQFFSSPMTEKWNGEALGGAYLV